MSFRIRAARLLSHRIWWTAAALAVFFAAGAWRPATTRAGHGEVTYAPRPGVQPKSGLSLSVDTTWVASSGYRPVRVAVAPLPPGPAKSDRVLRIEISPRDYYGYYQRLTVGRTLELPQGAASAETVISIPQSQVWRELKIDVFEGGERLSDLSFVASIPLSGTIRYGDDGAPSILFIDSDAPAPAQRSQLLAGTYLLPDVRILASLHPNGVKQAPAAVGMGAAIPTPQAASPAPPPSAPPTLAQVDDKTLLLELGQSSHLELLPPSQLPTNWIDYSGIDVIMLSRDELQQLKRRHRPQWQAIRDWLTTGGVMCVYDVGVSSQRLDALSRTLELPAEVPGQSRSPWESPGEQPWNEQYQFFASDQQTYSYDASGQLITPDPPPVRELGQLKFVTRRVQFGKVAAIANENPFPGAAAEWGQLFSALESSHWTWYQRHGLSLTSDNADYWDFLIPGVGLPPVNAFRILITLFAVIVGPVNYILLKRRKRLNFLLVTVPAGAAVVTVGLFLYALVSDGLGVRARVRSVTELDQRNRSSVSWSRQSYYASMSPSRGLVFPADTAVYPFQPHADDMRSRPERVLHWSGEQQQLARGYLRPRTLAQFLVVRANNDARSELVIRRSEQPAGESGSGLEVENRLGGRIQMLWLVDKQGRTFWGEDIPLDKSRALAVRSPVECQAAMTPVISAHAPAPPEGFDPNMNRYTMFGSYYYGPRYSGLPAATQAGGLLEKKLGELTANGWQPQPGSYVAIVDRSAEVPMGVESSKSEASFHIILGRW